MNQRKRCVKVRTGIVEAASEAPKCVRSRLQGRRHCFLGSADAATDVSASGQVLSGACTEHKRLLRANAMQW